MEKGLGVRDIRLVNLTILAKLRWRLIQNEGALWKDVLVEKYGNIISEESTLGGSTWPQNTSRWWKDIMMIDDGEGTNWFNSELSRKVHDGLDTYFWKTKWRGEMTFSCKYPRLFDISNKKEAMVGEMGVVSGSSFDWNFIWRRKLFVCEEDLLRNLLLDFHGFVRTQGVDDWKWKLEDDSSFSVRSTYKKLEVLARMGNDLGVEEKTVFGQIWKSPAPSMVVALSWKSLFNRIPTRSNLAHRNVLLPNDDLSCVLCDLEVESTNPLFVHCDVQVKQWFEVEFITPHNLFSHWLCWNGEVWYKRVLEGGCAWFDKLLFG